MKTGMRRFFGIVKERFLCGFLLFLRRKFLFSILYIGLKIRAGKIVELVTKAPCYRPDQQIPHLNLINNAKDFKKKELLKNIYENSAGSSPLLLEKIYELCETEAEKESFLKNIMAEHEKKRRFRVNTFCINGEFKNYGHLLFLTNFKGSPEVGEFFKKILESNSSDEYEKEIAEDFLG